MRHAPRRAEPRAPMTRTHVALLRGINVGRAKRIAMSDLRKAIESLGATDVRTLLNSGNAAFAWPAARAATTSIARDIEEAVEGRLGVGSLVVVLARAELAGILDALPASVGKLDPSRVLIGVPPTTSDLRALDALRAKRWAPETLDIGARAAVMGVQEGIADSRLVMAVDAAMGKRITSRNLATLRKLAALVEEEAT